MHPGEPHDPFALTLVSSHRTSEGLVSYLRCACGAWEVRTTATVAYAAPRQGGGRPIKGID
ncbi:hypothetical protein ACIBIZ_36700 [Nonomuraea spiralis]|uniref:Uncharacterized protein n=1 Tax=Nonomuraea spiralis TaxID=46182 RepID=A0ABV5IVD3_9ACTN|nr:MULTISPECIES: hypothetical protein [Nonomuraea]RSN05022.1 hypothetical protein DMB42_30045 [Nonomuraea sp. WAC 01424]GGS92328.1 hypothetical protein GCM10010176_040240 [Nonomuraea spiralis]